MSLEARESIPSIPTSHEIPEKINILKELIFLDPNPPSITVLPSLNTNIVHGMSIGPGCLNMAEGFELENIQGVRRRIGQFLERIGAAPLHNGFLMLTPQRGANPIVEITQDMAETAKKNPQTRADGEDVETDIRAEALVTTENVPLMVKPADCPAAVITDGKVLALLHLSRAQVNGLLIEQIVRYLKDKFSCDAANLQVGIFPGMGPKYHTLKDYEVEEPVDGVEDKRLIDGNAWGEYSKKSEDESMYHLDLLGYILEQLRGQGIAEKNIEAYGYDDRVDTYTLAAADPPEAFSQRWITATGQPSSLNGRNLVVAQLRTVA